MVVVPGYALSTPPDELADPIIDPHTGTHRPYFISHVGEVHGLDAGNGLHLGRRLHLEYSDGIGLVHHPVHRLVLEIYAAQVDVIALPLLDKLEGFLHLGQSAQGQKVDLHEAGLVDAVLVPVTDVAAIDGRLLHRHYVDEGRGADDHPSRVLGQVLGESVKLGRQVDEVTPHGKVHLSPKLGQRLHLQLQLPGAVRIYPLGQLIHLL